MKWLSLPEGTTQEQFADVTEGLPDLVFLDLSDCTKISDLAPVQRLHNLRYLVVNLENADPAPLYEMRQLRWLAVAGEMKEIDRAVIEHLQNTLPDTELSLLVPFCLGSGWILLVLPVIALSWWIAGRRNKMHPAGCHG
jgi:hypothetical protein